MRAMAMNMNMSADARFAPACQSMQFSSAFACFLDTAVAAVSFLFISLRLRVLHLVRIIMPKGQS